MAAERADVPRSVLPRSALLGLYRAITAVSHPVAAAILAHRTRRGKEDPDRLGERKGIASRPRPDGPLVWIHAASVGETVSVLPLIDRLRADNGLAVLLTTGTVTSAQIAEARFGKDGEGLTPANQQPAIHQYVPLDGPRFVRRFLAHWRPGLAVFVESELWPNIIVETAKTGTPLALVNARMSDRSFRRWQRQPAMIRALLARFDVCLAQSQADAERLAALGAKHVSDTGNLKYDAPPPAVDEAELERLARALAGRPCWIAASVHPIEDAAILKADAILRKDRPDLLTIIAPRHPSVGPAIETAAVGTHRLAVAMRSRGETPDAETAVYIVDTIGEMGLVYRLAPIVFMGGSLIPHGGQNPIEPAKLETAILHGPNVDNFAAVYAALHAAGGAEGVGDAGLLAERVNALLDEPAEVERMSVAAGEAVATLGGALDRSLAALAPVLPPGTGR